MTSVGLVREKTFEDIIKSKGATIEAPYRPYTELQRDPHIMVFNFRASLDEIREMELRAQMHRRRMEDIREAAARMGVPLGAFMASQPPFERENAAHMTVDPDYNDKVELSEAEREARIHELHDSLTAKRRQAAEAVEQVANEHPSFTEQIANTVGAGTGAVGAVFGYGTGAVVGVPGLGADVGNAIGKTVGKGAVRQVADAAEGYADFVQGVGREATKAAKLTVKHRARRAVLADGSVMENVA